MKSNENYFKRNFAQFQAQYDEESYVVHKTKKTELFSDIKGKVLELGPGTGVNFTFLNNLEISWIGVEPNSAMHSYLFDAARAKGVEARLLDCTSEDISLMPNAMDYVISTEVLCSVKDLDQTLREIKRVLKPGGQFVFLEHVIDHNNIFRRGVQKIVPHTPWRCFSDGCNPGRDIGKAIRSAGFSEVQYSDYMQEGKGIIQAINRPHIYGRAIK